MSLTAFNRLRRMQQVEAMKPENIEKQEEKVEEVIVEQPVVEQKVVEKVEEVEEQPKNRRRARK